MEVTKKRSFVRYLIPGFIFQSVVIAGGYGTGAEIREYFLTQGVMGGLMGMCVTLAIWSVLCAITFEFTRVFKTFDYKSLMSELLGPVGFLYELCYIALMLLVLGVVYATGGAMFNALTGATKWGGIAIIAVGTIMLIIKGNEAIEKALVGWSYVLYAVYAVFMVICLTKFSAGISEQIALNEVKPDWVIKGAQYAFYNLGCVPFLLFTIRSSESRSETVMQGILAGFLTIIPAALIFLCMAGYMPQTLEAEVPVTPLFEALDMPWLYILFEVVLFGTLIETGTGFIKALDDRVSRTVESKRGSVPVSVHIIVAVVCSILGIIVAQYGLIGLIAQGYGIMCWGMFAVYVVPMLTIGIVKIAKKA